MQKLCLITVNPDRALYLNALSEIQTCKVAKSKNTFYFVQSLRKIMKLFFVYDWVASLHTENLPYKVEKLKVQIKKNL